MKRDRKINNNKFSFNVRQKRKEKRKKVENFPNAYFAA